MEEKYIYVYSQKINAETDTLYYETWDSAYAHYLNAVRTSKEVIAGCGFGFDDNGLPESPDLVLSVQELADEYAIWHFFPVKAADKELIDFVLSVRKTRLYP